MTSCAEIKLIISGRELFMTDKSLNDSDIKFLETTGDTAVTVDESLFEVQYSQLYLLDVTLFDQGHFTVNCCW